MGGRGGRLRTVGIPLAHRAGYHVGMGSKLVAMTLRLPPELMRDIDARAARHGLRRTAWIVKALAFMVASPEQTTTVRQKL
jgi:hypothetical protein